MQTPGTDWNLFAGWVATLAGIASGAVIGLFFHREEWLGGYASYRRRLLRLGHISFFRIHQHPLWTERSLHTGHFLSGYRPDDWQRGHDADLLFSHRLAQKVSNSFPFAGRERGRGNCVVADELAPAKTRALPLRDFPKLVVAALWTGKLPPIADSFLGLLRMEARTLRD